MSDPAVSTPVLEVRDLEVEFATYGGVVKAVRGVSYAVERGRTLAVVGESGCGKSVTVQAIMGLIDMPPGRITGGSARLLGQELIGLGARAINRVRGAAIGMIFQDPMTSLNPTMKIGSQIAETLIAHRGMARREALAQAVQLLDRTRIPEAGKRANQYPFELSGGMLQRVMIAISLACKPALLIADEPSTALDVTIQNQVLELMREIQREEGMAIVLITHDLGVVARMADDVAVMYAGRIVESGPVEDIFYRSAHPYTTGLKRAMPGAARTHRKLVAIAGSPPDLFAVPPGCAYAPRCPHAMNICAVHDPAPSALGAQHRASCWLHHPQAPAVATTPPTMSDTR
ncbi:MAG: ABC transporter ATP-binding protein [Gammaproteobacteria bacterium]|jgi:oligopeptide/dipeptide ABC transporter ATP-binding protein|nr:ABC transporter ATP-binding protein [Gammaproteobacteria bacterium]MBP6051452.1 ABC transporter ATP-binding protein [Pseudomonadales bacterium]MBK6582776.1 ABC transporter ATP-binding protein [Gammaproteobacteria bacterium]MBK7171267.1 ABC transporter ATP-binding protein [Gammaproteobacteria bacterium]MBK7518905.1 ABC transporter ATP-binding protein [Gammaproteobacteria bacterium]